MTDRRADHFPVSDAPQVIYLQLGCDLCGEAADTEGVTWCADRIEECDVKYVRADRIEQLERELADWKAAAADADLDRNAAVAARERAEAALRELVRLKDLKDEITDYGATPGWEQTPWSANQREYVRCKPAAWEAARALVKEQPHGQ
jgi:hypothetical protein